MKLQPRSLTLPKAERADQEPQGLGMALSPIFYARGDSSTAQSAELTVQNTNTTPVTAIQFTSGTSGNLSLDFVPDNSDPDTLPQFDPNTQIIIGNNTYNFAFIKSGTVDNSRVPTALQNAVVYVIKVDINGDGDISDNVDQQYFFTLDPDGTPANMALIQSGRMALTNVNLAPPSLPVCYCKGTEICAPSGLRKVETLMAGDHVLTADGATRQVLWVGSTRISLATLKVNSLLWPISIAANAFGRGLPSTDLRVSPQHRILIEHPVCELLFGEPAVLVAAKHLVGTLAETEMPTGDVEYFHVLLEDHDMLVTNGLATESFQPARRMIDVMDEAPRLRLEAQLRALGEERLLTRKDRYRSLRRNEALVLLDALGRTPETSAAAAETRLHT